MNLIRRTIFGLFLALGCSNSYCQSIVPDTLWQIWVGDNGNEYPIAIHRTSSGNFSIVGYQELYYPYRKYTWLAQLNPEGNLISMARLDSSGLYGLNVLNMDILDSNRIVLCGKKSDSLWLSMVDTTGTTLWSGVYLDSIDVGDMSACDSNNIVVAGSSHDSLFLAKFSPGGILKWARVYSRGDHDIVEGISIAQLNNGEFVVGVNVSDWQGDYADTKAGIYLLTSSGDFESMHIYDNHGSNTETAQRIAITSAGKIVMLGNILLGSIGYDDASIRLLNSNGNELWYHQYGSGNLDHVYDMSLDASGNIYVSGYTKGFGIPNNRDYWIFKCDSLGTLVWNFWLGSDRWEVATSIIRSNGDVVFSGYGFDLSSPIGAAQTIVVRLHEGVSGVSDDNAQAQKRLLTVSYPNPFNASSIVDFVIPSVSRVRLALFDVLGKQLALLLDKELGPGQHQIVFDAGNLSSGTYLLQLQTKEGVTVHKMIVAK